MKDVLDVAARRRARLQAEIEQRQVEIGQINAFIRYGKALLDRDGTGAAKVEEAGEETPAAEKSDESAEDLSKRTSLA